MYRIDTSPVRQQKEIEQIIAKQDCIVIYIAIKIGMNQCKYR